MNLKNMPIKIASLNVDGVADRNHFPFMITQILSDETSILDLQESPEDKGTGEELEDNFPRGSIRGALDLKGRAGVIARLFDLPVDYQDPNDRGQNSEDKFHGRQCLCAGPPEG